MECHQEDQVVQMTDERQKEATKKTLKKTLIHSFLHK